MFKQHASPTGNEKLIYNNMYDNYVYYMYNNK